MQSRLRLFRAMAAFAVIALLTATPLAAQTTGTTDGSSQPSEASPGVLADVLEDEQARERLIADLRRMEAERPPAEGEAVPERALADRLVSAAQATAQTVTSRFDDTVAALTQLTRPSAVDWHAIGKAALELSILIAATMALHIALRALARWPYSRANRWVLHSEAHGQSLRRSTAAGVMLVTDAVVVVLVWLSGWGLALFVLGERGSVNAQPALFLTAFIAIEGGKIALRLVFAKRYDGLRLLPLESPDAAYWQRFLTRLVNFVGYGLVLVVPLVADLVAPGMARALYVLVVLLGFGYALVILWRNRHEVCDRLSTAAQRKQPGTARLTLRLLASLWHLLAIAYAAALALALVIRPEQALPYIATATLQTLVAIGVGLIASSLIGQAIGRGVPVGDGLRAKLPQVEVRLNAFVPRGLQAAGIIIGVLVFALVLDGWQLFDLRQWLATDTGWQVLATIASLGIIVVLAVAVWIALASWIDYALSPGLGSGEPTARRHTLLALFRNALAVLLIVITTMILVAELGINIGPLIAGAGVIGIALGFGAQTLVQDIIGGIFIQLENSINTGDWVSAGNISGTAETVSIRSVGLRDLEGTFHFIPFSAVDTVSNYNRDFSYHMGYYGVAYREDTDQVVPHLMAAYRDLMDDAEIAPLVMGDLEIDGVTEFAASAVRIRVRIMTHPGKQWTVGRAYNRLVKKHLDAAGIEIPYPHTTLYFGSDRDGEAPPANVRLLGTAETESGNGGATADSEAHAAGAGDGPATSGAPPSDHTSAEGPSGDGAGGD